MTALQKEIEAGHWGIEPLPEEHRTLSGSDLAVLWANLGVGVLVVITGGFLTASPAEFGFGMSLPAAIATILIGSLLGCGLLALVGAAGSREAVPTMTLLRPVLGDAGSWIPSALNALQLIGWTAFEIWAMARIADLVTRRLFGGSRYGLWVLAFGSIALLMSIWGPLGVVRRWMERFASWILLGLAGLMTVGLLLAFDTEALVSGGAGGSIIFGIPLDLVIVMPISWLPLVADYNRYASNPRASLTGTFTGYMCANVWFYLLGAVLFAQLDAGLSPEGLALALMSLGGMTFTGLLMIAGLLTGESDQAFANVYSGGVSLRNILPSVDNRVLVAAVAAGGTALALGLTMAKYEFFLFLLGSLFIPLFGVWFADYYVVRGRRKVTGLRWSACVAWLVGFLVYHWIAPTPLAWWLRLVKLAVGRPLSEKFPWLGASIPAFLAAFALYLALRPVSRDKQFVESAHAG